MGSGANGGEGKGDVDGERAMMGRSRKEGGERCYVYTLMGEDVKNLMREDHSVMRVSDESQVRQGTTRATVLKMASYGGGVVSGDESSKTFRS